MKLSEELRSKPSRDNRALLDRAADRIDELEAGYRKQSEVINEFVERLKERLFTIPTVYNSHFGRMIDDVVKEMKGGAE